MSDTDRDLRDAYGELDRRLEEWSTKAFDTTARPPHDVRERMALLRWQQDILTAVEEANRAVVDVMEARVKELGLDDGVTSTANDEFLVTVPVMADFLLRDEQHWLVAEAARHTDVAAWLLGEEQHGQRVMQWLLAESLWQTDIEAWLEREERERGQDEEVHTLEWLLAEAARKVEHGRSLERLLLDARTEMQETTDTSRWLLAEQHADGEIAAWLIAESERKLDAVVDIAYDADTIGGWLDTEHQWNFDVAVWLLEEAGQEAMDELDEAEKTFDARKIQTEWLITERDWQITADGWLIAERDWKIDAIMQVSVSADAEQEVVDWLLAEALWNQEELEGELEEALTSTNGQGDSSRLTSAQQLDAFRSMPAPSEHMGYQEQIDCLVGLMIRGFDEHSDWASLPLEQQGEWVNCAVDEDGAMEIDNEVWVRWVPSGQENLWGVLKGHGGLAEDAAATFSTHQVGMAHELVMELLTAPD